MTRVLITAGTVYGPLDANKLVGNRVRGLWALGFAEYLLQKGHQVTLLVPDTMPKEVLYKHVLIRGNLQVVEHKGFWDYRDKCLDLAKTHDAADDKNQISREMSDLRAGLYPSQHKSLLTGCIAFFPLDAIAFFVEEPVQRIFRLLASTYTRISKAALESQGLTDESQKLDE